VRILIVDDDLEIGILLARGLLAEGYEVALVANGVDALIAVTHESFSLAAIDVMMPRMSGFEVCRRIRESGSTMPVLLLTARDAVEDRVFGLDCGADDYLTKPFAFVELAARIRALLRRNASGDKLTVTTGQLTLDSVTLRVSADGKELSMSPKEFALLRLLAQHAGTALSRTEILEEVWRTTTNIDQNIVDQYISYLRRKLDPIDSGVQILTVRGTGYLLEVVE
jgi:two-component system, OmpR family, response regulator